MSITFSKIFPVFHLNDDIYLREHESKDIQCFLDYYTPEVSQHILAPKPETLEDAKAEMQYCKNLFHFKRGIYWSITEKKSDKMIGAIGLSVHALNMRGELHYDLAKAYWGRGIITLAIAAILDYAFNTLGVIRVEALTTHDNIASQKVLIKNNFIYEGCLHAYRYYLGKAMNVDIFAITQEQYSK